MLQPRLCVPGSPLAHLPLPLPHVRSSSAGTYLRCWAHSNSVAEEGGRNTGVLPLMTVDNSDFSPSGLTVHSSLLMIRKLSLPHIRSCEDGYGSSCVRVPAGGLSSALSGTAVASGLVPCSAFLLKRRGQAQQASPSAQTALPRRLPRLSSRLHSLAG